MARNTDAAVAVVEDDEIEDEMPRSNAIDVTDPEDGKNLLAAFRGIYWFFGGRVERWEITPDGEIVAHGFSTYDKYDPERILRDITGRNRRLDFGPSYLIVQGVEPQPFTNPQEMTNFSVNFLKGSEDDATSKTPPYVREAIAEYKAGHGLKVRRGRKRTILRLDNLESLDESMLEHVNPDELQRLIQIAQRAAAKGTPVAAVTSNGNS